METAVTPLESQVATLQEQFPGTTMQLLPSGAGLVSIPNVRLSAGWSKGATEILFLAPAGFPHAQPDCFWADADLRLQGGGLPQSAAVNTIPETARSALWFSWHLGRPWNPNRDTLLTWFGVIRNRLREAR